MKRKYKEEIGQLLRLAEDEMRVLRRVLELTNGSHAEIWRIDDWQRRTSKLLDKLESSISEYRRRS